MIKTKTLNLKLNKGSCEKSKKKMSFDISSPFPCLGDSEDLNNLVEESKAKNTKKYTTPSK